MHEATYQPMLTFGKARAALVVRPLRDLSVERARSLGSPVAVPFLVSSMV